MLGEKKSQLVICSPYHKLQKDLQIRRKQHRHPLLARQSPNLVLYALAMWYSNTHFFLNERMPYTFLLRLANRQASFLRTEGPSRLSLSTCPTQHACCCDALSKHRPEKFVKQSITALPHSLKKSAGWSRLLPAMHHWSGYGLQITGKIVPVRSCREHHSPAPHINVWTHSLCVLTTGKLTVLLHLGSI